MFRFQTLLISLLFSCLAKAAGPSTGGGGDVIILPNDDVVLADPFLDHGGPQPNNMPPLRSLNPRLLQAVDSYFQVLKPHLTAFNEKSDIAKLLEELRTRKNNLRFYAVKDAQELALFCAPGGRKIYTLPDGAKIEQVACTAGDETFLVEPIFLRLSLRDQALLLMHERLTGLRDKFGGKNYSAIARFTTGLRLFLTLYKEQYKGLYRRLEKNEKNNLTELYTAIEEIELRDSEVTNDSFQWEAASYGGGRVHALSQIDDSALIPLNVVVGKDSHIGRGTKLTGIKLRDAHPIFYDLGDNVIFDKVSLGAVDRIKVGSDSNLKNLTLESSVFNVGDRAQIEKVKIADTSAENRASAFSGGHDLNLSNVHITAPVQMADNIELKNFNIKSRVELASNQKVSDGYIDRESLDRHPAGTKVYSRLFQWTSPIHLNVKSSDRDWNPSLQIPLTLNDGNNSVSVSGKLTYTSTWQGFFDDVYLFNFTTVKLKLKIEPNQNLTLPQEARTVQRGMIFEPGPAKFLREIRHETSYVSESILGVVTEKLKNEGLDISCHYDRCSIEVPTTPQK